MMSIEVILFLAGQAIAILIGIGLSYIHTREQLVELKIRMQHIEIQQEQGLKNLRSDHSALSEQVGGISRAVARLEGAQHPVHTSHASSQ